MSFFPLQVNKEEEKEMLKQLKLISLKLNCLQPDELVEDDLEE